jgi:hypothetical protein
MSVALKSYRYVVSIPFDPLSQGNYKYTYQSDDGKTYVLKFCQETASIPRLSQDCNNEVRP